MRKVVAVRVTSTKSEAVFELTIPRMNHHSEVDRQIDVPGVGSCTEIVMFYLPFCLMTRLPNICAFSYAES